MAEEGKDGDWDLLFYVQHLLGIGHLQRAALLANALHESGLKVRVVSGGPKVEQVSFDGPEVVQLPPLKVLDESFTLVDESGSPVTQDFKDRRSSQLCALLGETKPKLILVELFPFGRRQMRFELIPFLKQAQEIRPRPAIVCSLRDILNHQTKPEKIDWMLQTFQDYFDLAVVHGDARFLTLEESFPQAARLAGKIEYSGYIVRPQAQAKGMADESGRGEVLVSAGGGAVGRPLVECALAARRLSCLRERPWRFLLGPNFPEAEFLRFQHLALEQPDSAGIIVERARADFPQLLRNCHLSISQGGYNTVMETLAFAKPAVIVPFAAGGHESEQTLRTGKLAAAGLLEMLEEKDLTPVALAAAIGRIAGKTPVNMSQKPNLDLEGGRKTATILKRLIDRVGHGHVG